jgi:hypothetical protein
LHDGAEVWFIGWRHFCGLPPAGTPSDWSAAEQRELRNFLPDAHASKAKFLLTSRRDEHAWLGEMPVPVQAPPMQMQERLQLAGAIAEHGETVHNLGGLSLTVS